MDYLNQDFLISLMKNGFVKHELLESSFFELIIELLEFDLKSSH